MNEMVSRLGVCVIGCFLAIWLPESIRAEDACEPPPLSPGLRGAWFCDRLCWEPGRTSEITCKFKLAPSDLDEYNYAWQQGIFALHKSICVFSVHKTEGITCGNGISVIGRVIMTIEEPAKGPAKAGDLIEMSGIYDQQKTLFFPDQK